MSFADKMKEQEDVAKSEGIAQSQGNDWFKFKEGDNVFRVLAEPELIFEKFKTGICYTDCGYEGNPKFLTWIFDLKEGKIKLAKLPYKIGKWIAELEQDEDYSFSGFPMPYNLKVKAKNAGSKEVEYTLIASPKREEITEEIRNELGKKNSIGDIVQKMKEHKKEEHVKDGTWQANQDRKAKLAAELAEARVSAPAGAVDYPTEDIDPEDIPF